MRNEDEYRAVIDTIRTVCMNAEADLAIGLASAMARPREAKRLLQNLYSTPGDLPLAATAPPEERSRSAVDAPFRNKRRRMEVHSSR